VYVVLVSLVTMPLLPTMGMSAIVSPQMSMVAFLQCDCCLHWEVFDCGGAGCVPTAATAAPGGSFTADGCSAVAEQLLGLLLLLLLLPLLLHSTDGDGRPILPLRRRNCGEHVPSASRRPRPSRPEPSMNGCRMTAAGCPGWSWALRRIPQMSRSDSLCIRMWWMPRRETKTKMDPVAAFRFRDANGGILALATNRSQPPRRCIFWSPLLARSQKE